VKEAATVRMHVTQHFPFPNTYVIK